MVAVKFSFRKCHRYIHLISSLCSLSVHGGWGPWGAWSACTKTCGSGTQIQERRCDSPRPDHGGRQCEGAGQQSQACNTRNCPGMNNGDKLFLANRFNDKKDFESYLGRMKVPQHFFRLP